MVQSRELYRELSKETSLEDKLGLLHRILKDRQEFVDRIGVALYDPKTDVLKTFLHSSDEYAPLVHYQAKLSQAPSLLEILRQGHPRIINDLSVFGAGRHEHTKRIAAQGYGSSYTLPMIFNGIFFGFVFFNSYRKNAFKPEVLDDLDLFGQMVSNIVITDVMVIRTMMATVKAARDITYYRDTETAEHLDRIAHYSRLIANELAEPYGLSDEFVEHVYLFASLHDIGKLGVPDHILKKPAKLSDEEYEIMKSHSKKGREMVDSILRDFGLHGLDHAEMLRHITEYHHEAVDGSGYPHGMHGSEIPLEARIVAVADIFDALTSDRPYKHAWTNDQAYALMRRLAGVKLDRDCVKALIKNQEEVERIQSRFLERRCA